MKGTLGLCLLLSLACTTVYSATGDEVTPANQPKPKIVVKKDEKLPGDLLKCQVKSDSTFEKFEWKFNGETEKLICDSDAIGSDCDPEDDFNTVYEVGTAANKYNLKLPDDVAISDKYAGKYSCALTMSDIADNEKYESDVTVAAAPVCTDATVATVEVGDTKVITCTQAYTGEVPTTLKYHKADNSDTEASDEKTDAGRKVTFTVPTNTPAVLVYTCKASAAGDDTYKDHECTSKVTVVAKTIATKPVDTVAQIGAKDVKMHCTVVVGVTTYTSVTWSNTAGLSCVGKEADTKACTGTGDSNYNIDAAKKHDLNIKVVKKESAGEYTCTVDTPALSYEAKLIPIAADSPTCSKNEKTVICKVTYEGDKQPTVEWYKGDAKVTAAPPVEGKVVTVETEVDDVKATYMCRVMNGDGKKAYECLGHDKDSGAPALDARLYQSTLMSLVVVWLWYQYK